MFEDGPHVLIATKSTQLACTRTSSAHLFGMLGTTMVHICDYNQYGVYARSWAAMNKGSFTVHIYKQRLVQQSKQPGYSAFRLA